MDEREPHRSSDEGSQSREEGESPLDDVVPSATKTPLFQAFNALRYQRQAMIKKLQDQTRRRLLCYVAGPNALISRDDTMAFVDLLHNVPESVDLDLLLHTPGGDIDAAEKLISMVRSRVGTATLRVVVPDYAKSAGTLMALGADLIVMSETSELGPIDPQIVLADGNGNMIQHSVHTYLDAYDECRETLSKHPQDVVAQMMLQKLDPATVKLFQAVRERARVLAEKLLRQGTSGGQINWSKAASALLDTGRWQSHGQMISWSDALDAEVGLPVEHLEASSTLWRDYWQLYCLQRLAITDDQKLFESDYVSIPIDGSR